MTKSELKMGPSIMSPCKDCTCRVPGCHDKCFRYKNWSTRYHAEKDLLINQFKKDNLAFDEHVSRRKKPHVKQ